jgi:hypothetical protein
MNDSALIKNDDLILSSRDNVQTLPFLQNPDKLPNPVRSFSALVHHPSPTASGG